MKLLAGEHTILQSDEGALMLTTHRVRLQQRWWGQLHVVSITLEAVVSAGIVMRRYPILAVLAGILAVFGLAMLPNDRDAAQLALAVALLLTLIYLLARPSILSIASAGDRILVATRGMTKENLIEFIDALESAKLARPRHASTIPTEVG